MCPVDVLSSLCVRDAAARYSNFPLQKKENGRPVMTEPVTVAGSP